MCTWLLWSAADGERVPLVLSDSWDVDVNIISRFELEELRTSDHQVSHLTHRETPGDSHDTKEGPGESHDTERGTRWVTWPRGSHQVNHMTHRETPGESHDTVMRQVMTNLGGQQVDLHNVKPTHTGHSQSYGLLKQEDQTRNHKPLPEVGAVDHQQRPDPHVGQVRPVEHLRTKGHTCQPVGKGFMITWLHDVLLLSTPQRSFSLNKNKLYGSSVPRSLNASCVTVKSEDW